MCVVILPASALDHLTRLQIQFPMLFKLINKSKNRETHCGVLEFVAEEGRCYLPYWVSVLYTVKTGLQYHGVIAQKHYSTMVQWTIRPKNLAINMGVL